MTHYTSMLTQIIQNKIIKEISNMMANVSQKYFVANMNLRKRNQTITKL